MTLGRGIVDEFNWVYAFLALVPFVFFRKVMQRERAWLIADLEQLQEADAGPADYIAYGPVFATLSKRGPDAIVGLDGIRAARAQRGSLWRRLEASRVPTRSRSWMPEPTR